MMKPSSCQKSLTESQSGHVHHQPALVAGTLDTDILDFRQHHRILGHGGRRPLGAVFGEGCAAPAGKIRYGKTIVPGQLGQIRRHLQGRGPGTGSRLVIDFLGFRNQAGTPAQGQGQQPQQQRRTAAHVHPSLNLDTGKSHGSSHLFLASCPQGRQRQADAAGHQPYLLHGPLDGNRVGLAEQVPVQSQ